MNRIARKAIDTMLSGYDKKEGIPVSNEETIVATLAGERTETKLTEEFISIAITHEEWSRIFSVPEGFAPCNSDKSPFKGTKLHVYFLKTSRS